MPSPRQTSDCMPAITLITGYQPSAVIDYREHDSDIIIQIINTIGAKPVIPTKKNLIVQRNCDYALCAKHNLVERLFSKLKY